MEADFSQTFSRGLKTALEAGRQEITQPYCRPDAIPAPCLSSPTLWSRQPFPKNLPNGLLHARADPRHALLVYAGNVLRILLALPFINSPTLDEPLICIHLLFTSFFPSTFFLYDVGLSFILAEC